MPLEGLKYRGVLAVNRVERHAVGLRRLHDQGTGGDQCLLVGQRDVFAGFNCCHRRDKSGRTDNARDDDIRIGKGRAGDQPLGAAENLRGFGAEHIRQRRPFALSEHGHHLGTKRANLLRQQGDVAPTGQRRHPVTFRIGGYDL